MIRFARSPLFIIITQSRKDSPPFTPPPFTPRPSVILEFRFRPPESRSRSFFTFWPSSARRIPSSRRYCVGFQEIATHRTSSSIHPPWHSHPSSPTSKTTPAQLNRRRSRRHRHSCSRTRHSALRLRSPPATHHLQPLLRHRSQAHQISLPHQRTIRQNCIRWLHWGITWITWRWRMRKWRICREREARCLVEGGRMSCVTERGRRI